MTLPGIESEALAHTSASFANWSDVLSLNLVVAEVTIKASLFSFGIGLWYSFNAVSSGKPRMSRNMAVGVKVPDIRITECACLMIEAVSMEGSRHWSERLTALPFWEFSLVRMRA